MPSKTILLIRGLAREKRHWYGFDEQVQNTFPNDKVVCIDIPGAGKYNKINAPVSIPKIQNFIRKEFLKENSTEELHIVAISLGGMIALNWASSFPVEPQSLVLMNSSVASISPIHHRLKPAAIKLILKIVLQTNSYSRERKIADLVSNLTSQKKDEIAQVFSEYAMNTPITLENAMRQITAAIKFKPNFATIKCKGLILTSKNDNMVDNKCSYAIHKKLHWPLKTHPIAGHDLSLDDPDWVCHQLKNFYSVL